MCCKGGRAVEYWLDHHFRMISVLKSYACCKYKRDRQIRIVGVPQGRRVKDSGTNDGTVVRRHIGK